MKQLNKHKWTLLITSILILLPMVFGFIIWNKLPEQMAAHWGINGIDYFLPRLASVAALPCVLLAIHWIGVFLTLKDNEKSRQGDKTLKLALWITPAISFYVNGVIYATALCIDFDISRITVIILGLFMLIVGNYLPKFSRNRTFGIKVYWALSDDENWNATHRFGGKVWAICGIILMLSVFVPFPAILYIVLATFLIMAVAPTVYSYVFYKKQLKSGKISKQSIKAANKTSRTSRIISIVLVSVVIVGIATVMLTGDVSVNLGEDELTVKTTYYSGIVVRYEDVEKIEYRENAISGMRISGFGSPRLLLGKFENDELGRYTRYTYGGDRPCIILTVDGKCIVLGCYDAKDTVELYNDLMEKCSNTGE